MIFIKTSTHFKLHAVKQKVSLRNCIKNLNFSVVDSSSAHFFSLNSINFWKCKKTSKISFSKEKTWLSYIFDTKLDYQAVNFLLSKQKPSKKIFMQQISHKSLHWTPHSWIVLSLAKNIYFFSHNNNNVHCLMNIIESNSFWKRFTPWKDFIMTENVNNNAGASE